MKIDPAVYISLKNKWKHINPKHHAFAFRSCYLIIPYRRRMWDDNVDSLTAWDQMFPDWCISSRGKIQSKPALFLYTYIMVLIELAYTIVWLDRHILICLSTFRALAYRAPQFLINTGQYNSSSEITTNNSNNHLINFVLNRQFSID